MQAVGRLGSYISRSVYTVSGPFHPFGGAVDIIVVEQPDGSYKSSPWYVRFGKFQGVLKSKEKVVTISVNGVDADFHMYLDHKGEAFFLREVDGEERESAVSPPSSSGEDMEGRSGRWPLKSKSCNFDSNLSDTFVDQRKVVTRTNSRRSQFMGLVFGRRSASEEGIQMKEDPSGVARSESLELAEFTADLLDLKWSTNLDSPKSKGKNENASLSSLKDEKNSVPGSNQDETGDTSQANYKEVESTTEENDVETKSSTSEYILKTTTTVESVREDVTLSSSEPLMTSTDKSDFLVSSVSVVSEVAKSDSLIQDSSEKFKSFPEIQQCLDKEDKFSFVHEEKTLVSEGPTETIVTECYSQLVCVHKSNGPLKNCLPRENQHSFGVKDKHETSVGPLCNSDPQCTQAPRNAEEEELLLFGDLDGVDSSDAKPSEQTCSDHEGKDADNLVPSRASGGPSDAKCNSSLSFDSSNIKDYLNDAGVQRTKLCSVSSDACINEMGNDQPKGVTRMARSLPSLGPLSNNLEAGDLGKSPYPPMYPGVRSDADKNLQSSGARTTTGDATILKESKVEPANPPLRRPGSMDSSGESGSNWSFPFKRSRSREVSQADVNGSENPKNVTLNNSNDLESGTDVKVIKKKVRMLTPTTEQLASLNLKEGKNIVIFTFSTAMLGQQQVDARIFLWRWDTRIVISDVDGTITRSDLLGQVMPLVGMDWSQTGVAHLFSAIKENGYQLLFLSARSISQSFITRQFLLNIKQDGKALPDGPVVISPDGLFPSLFREVVRRAPHEFKIACLEDIKALFPPDRNPFYAGFGNRDTDEFSYLKVGIPRGKIFIINPKGEIAVNRRVDTKSYLALHTLVHGMFPTMSSCEQEDFNSWNYWKIPPPMIDL